MKAHLNSLPITSNSDIEISSKLLGTPNKNGQSEAKLFKPLKEDNDYLICEDGRLYSKKKNRFLKGKIDNVGYQVYCLAIVNELTGKKGRMLYAHRLVAEYFLENPNNYPYVHHKDENKLNNHVSNLEWVTPQQNMLEHNKMNPKKEVSSPKYKIEDLPGEEWRVMRDDPRYSVSNMGRVINNTTLRLIKIDTHQTYHRINLRDGKATRHYYLHRLVYCTFTEDYDLDGYVIDHIDSDPSNNKLENLQKLTHSENNQKRFK